MKYILKALDNQLRLQSHLHDSHISKLSFANAEIRELRLYRTERESYVDELKEKVEALKRDLEISRMALEEVVQENINLKKENEIMSQPLPLIPIPKPPVPSQPMKTHTP